ncbi:uncharacterized protein LOC128245831 [Mya arenaria]|uniref:uncharacterized protein LOC128245831 n=1 Tax=Mya arenaria TaxID=6604 RepID=UPI0022DF8CFF|nr:uncharacterized protein LOC128245831 [Mya arenaria]
MAASPYPVWGSLTPGVTNSGQATPNSPGSVNNDLVTMLIKRLDSMDSKLARLDSIQSSVNTINTRIQSMDTKINDLESKVRDIERSREFDSQTLSEISKQHKDLDSFTQKMKKFEEEHRRAHRIGPYQGDKTRPIVAKFSDFPDREKVRRAAKELKGTQYGISEQFPKQVVEQRRKLVPIMLQARKDGKEAFIKVDKLFINNHLYRGPC